MAVPPCRRAARALWRASTAAMGGYVLLSILIPTVPGRERKLERLLATLDPQVRDRTDVELLVLRDNRRMTIGEKRNKMIVIARGLYVSFIDDDDAVAADYVEAICAALRADAPDVVCFTVDVVGRGRRRLCRYHPDITHENLPTEYRRKPNHLMVWRREIAATVPFQPVRFGEDTEWAERASVHAREVTAIERVLYTYQYDRHDNSRTSR